MQYKQIKSKDTVTPYNTGGPLENYISKNWVSQTQGWMKKARQKSVSWTVLCI